MKALVKELENTFSRITNQSYPYEWDENHITYSLMRELRNTFKKRIVRYDNFSKIIEWFSFKNKGRSESAFGDISLIVNIQFSSGEKLQGVAFLEAKRDSNNGNFESMSTTQLKTIHSNAPYSYLLFYLHKRQDWPLKFPDGSTWESSMWVSPSNTVIQKLPQVKPIDNLKMLRVALPLSMQITSRYFWGHDLDYRENVFKFALEGLGDFTPPQFLGVINVYYEGQVPFVANVGDTWEEIV